MDWTGGMRRRFAPGRNNATLQKQKAHFAKARAALYNTHGSHHSLKLDSVRTRRDLETPLSRNGEPPIGVESNKDNDPISTSRSAIEPIRPTSKQRRRSMQPQSIGLRHEERRTQQSPSVAYISSSQYSSPASPAVSLTRVKERDSRSPSAPQMRAMTEEESLLLANRRRLLARTDWLGLAATRPVQMKFQSSHDKARIGKRRKVDSVASHRGKPAGRRMVTHLFEERLRPPDLTMSGAMPEEGIKIRIGTDALASQTQPSRRSHTPGNTSMRPPSTEFGPLSEEPMLLGADGDIYEGLHSNNDDARLEYLAIPDAKSLAHLIDSRANQGVQHVCQSQELSAEEGQLELGEQFRIRVDGIFHEADMSTVVRIPDSAPPHPKEWVSPKQQNIPGTVSSRVDRYTMPMPTSAAGDYDRKPSTTEQAPELDEDEMWRRLMDIEPYSSSHASLVAVKSSSLHLTSSENSHRPVLHVSNGLPDYVEMNSNPKGAGTQASTVQDPRGETGISVLSENVQSPSASLKDIIKLAEQPAPPNKQAEEEANDDALWREFICGSEADSEEHSFDLDAICDGDDAAAMLPPPTAASPTLAVSDLGTSNRTTVGDTLFLTGNSSSSMSLTSAKRRKQFSSADIRYLPDVNGSKATQSVVQNPEVNSIEDDLPVVDQQRQSLNIHVCNTSILDPKRFKKPQKKASPPSRRSRNALSGGKAKKKSDTKLRSVYDLVDSDGTSVT